MSKKSPIHTVDDETIERIKEIIQAVIDQTELITAYWVQSLAQARLVNQAAVGIKTLVDIDTGKFYERWQTTKRRAQEKSSG
jgi:hypothetical protein